MSGCKDIFAFIFFIVIAIGVCIGVAVNYDYMVARCYEKRLIRNPAEYSRCPVCNRARPNKKMSWSRECEANICDEHFGY